MSRTAVVLAGGAGERMRSRVPKVLHPIAGRSLIAHVLDQLETLSIDRIVVVVGVDGGQVAKHVTDLEMRTPLSFVEQASPEGTADATATALGAFGDRDPDGELLIIPGDVPLITAATLESLLTVHHESNAALTVLTAEMAGELPIVRRDKRGSVVGVGGFDPSEGATGDDGGAAELLESDSATEELTERSPLIFCVRRSLLAPALRRLSRGEHESAVVEVVQVIAATGNRIVSMSVDDASEALGVNERRQLADAERVLRERIAQHWLERGVTIVDPARTYIDAGVVIGPDARLLPGVVLEGSTTIGAEAVIGPDTRLVDTIVGEGATVTYSVATEAEIGAQCSVGPFAHLRPGSHLADRVKVGSFVEVKNSDIGEGSKLPHLAYVGDADVGANANIGCGTITANYDGRKKHRTAIGSGARTGSNSVLVAPVQIGDGAYTAAGAVVVNDVPAGALARGVPATNIENWVAERDAREDQSTIEQT